jgi:hypothetical protein
VDGELAVVRNRSPASPHIRLDLPVFHAEFRQPIAGMHDQRDYGGTHAVKHGSYGPKIAEVDVEGAQRGDDHEIR